MKDRPAHITFTPPDNDTAFQKAYRAALTITPNPDAAKALAITDAAEQFAAFVLEIAHQERY